MSELSKSYEPKAVEAKWYQQWLERDAFAGRRDESREPYCVMIPPPNVTGMLHMGHILNNTLQDIFIRRARLEGKSALWYPGTDHAGIATQTRVEKELRKEGLHRRDLGRDKFLEKVWEWKEEHGGIILNQLKKLGASCDWDRTSFTLDEKYSRAVLTSFVKLYERGYVYRGMRMSNWCPVSQTALSNEEVIMKPQKGLLYKMRYEIVEHEGEYLEISTTRPETIMGDTAVAVHPEDERYKHLVGKHVWRPFPRAKIKIIADTVVDKEFGTGCLKVTPAHDAVDFEIGQRHGLEIIDVLNPDGTVNELGGEDFVGLDRFEARKKAAKKLEELGLLIETEDYENNVGFSERADVPVEPRLTQQWWLKYPKVDEAKRAVKDGIIKFHPKRWEKVYLHWLDHGQENNIDWCLSRQLWWGHRIPVWYRNGISETVRDYANPEHVHVSVDGPSDPENWTQDSDVLDTWASSWLWPFANFGWPEPDSEEAKELEYFYPTSTLVTGFDIIFLWVARMVMAGLEFMGEGKPTLSNEEIAKRIPFRDVYITGLIRDEKGRKMSKSLGNSPDPLDLIEKYGADGLRFGIVNIAPSGQDILFSEERIEVGRNFCNKLWNAARFRQMSGPAHKASTLENIIERIGDKPLSGFENWIVSRLLETMKQLEDAFSSFEMHQMTHQLHNFFWGDFCDWYVEASKQAVQSKDAERAERALAISDLVLRTTLQMLNPVMPHITEELWHGLSFGDENSLIQESQLITAKELEEKLASQGCSVNATNAAEIGQLKELISRTRALKAEFNVGNRKDVSLAFAGNEAATALILRNKEVISLLAGAGEFVIASEASFDLEKSPAVVTSLGTVSLDLSSAVDVDAEKNRISKEIEKLAKQIAAGEGKLSNDTFVSRAPAHIVEGARKQLNELKSKSEELNRLLKALG